MLDQQQSIANEQRGWTMTIRVRTGQALGGMLLITMLCLAGAAQAAPDAASLRERSKLVFGVLPAGVPNPENTATEP